MSGEFYSNEKGRNTVFKKKKKVEAIENKTRLQASATKCWV